MGVNELKDVVVFVAKVGNVTEKVMEDGKVDMKDAYAASGLILPAISAARGAQDIPAEISDLDEAEKNELLAAFKVECDLKNDNIERYAELGVEAALKLAQFFAHPKKA